MTKSVTPVELTREQLRFYAPPFSFAEPEGEQAAMIRDANGQTVAMMMWPGHSAEDTDAAVAETYAVARTFAQALSNPLFDEDWLEETISDSLDMDWRPRDAAKLIISRLRGVS